jgi:hypothetical protein
MRWYDTNEGCLGFVYSQLGTINGASISSQANTPIGTSCILPLTEKGARRYVSENISAYDLSETDLAPTTDANHFLFVSLGLLKDVIVNDSLLLLRAALQHLSAVAEVKAGTILLAPAGDRRRKRLLRSLGFEVAGRTRARREVYRLTAGPELAAAWKQAREREQPESPPGLQPGGSPG